MSPPLHDDGINVLDDSAESFLLHNGVTDHPTAQAAPGAREAIVTTPITTRQDEPVGH